MSSQEPRRLNGISRMSKVDAEGDATGALSSDGVGWPERRRTRVRRATPFGPGDQFSVNGTVVAFPATSNTTRVFAPCTAPKTPGLTKFTSDQALFDRS